MSATATNVRRKIINAARRLSRRVDELSFAEPVTHVYNPLDYAWDAHAEYLKRVNDAGVRVIFLGMHPGPSGMALTGVPFGEIAAARDWLGINVAVNRPDEEHPKRPIEGFECQRSEVSGRRLWGLFQERFADADEFFEEHFVANYCPLVFMEESARNRTPDKLPAAEREPLDQACDQHLSEILSILQPEFAVGVGSYAEQCLKRVLKATGSDARLSRILHPSPASPAANKDWAGKVTVQMHEAGIW